MKWLNLLLGWYFHLEKKDVFAGQASGLSWGLSKKRVLAESKVVYLASS